MMQHNALNYVAALRFLAAAMREGSAIWLVLGCVCLHAGLARSRRLE